MMSFLPLVSDRRPDDHGPMHPYAIDHMVQERIQELHRLARLDAGTRHLTLPPWRRRVGRRLAALGVAVGVPAVHRPTALGRIDAALSCDSAC
jgi:hypothetical protein